MRPRDPAAIVAENADGDARVLVESGFTVTWQARLEGFRRASVERDGQGLKIEWAYDSAFRFLPVEPDPVLGFRLHDADLAVNNLLRRRPPDHS